jgi:hypothetical protein
VKDRARALHEAAVERFGHTITLRRIGRRKATLRALLLDISGKFITCELTAAIRTVSLDVRAMLGLRPRKSLVGPENFVFSPKRFKHSIESSVKVT